MACSLVKVLESCVAGKNGPAALFHIVTIGPHVEDPFKYVYDEECDENPFKDETSSEELPDESFIFKNSPKAPVLSKQAKRHEQLSNEVEAIKTVCTNVLILTRFSPHIGIVFNEKEG